MFRLDNIGNFETKWNFDENVNTNYSWIIFFFYLSYIFLFLNNFPPCVMPISVMPGSYLSLLFLGHAYLCYAWVMSISVMPGSCLSLLCLGHVYLCYAWVMPISALPGSCLTNPISSPGMFRAECGPHDSGLAEAAEAAAGHHWRGCWAWRRSAGHPRGLSVGAAGTPARTEEDRGQDRAV